jgi:hypothetical protein
LARKSQISKIVSNSRNYPRIPTVCQGGSTRLAHELNSRMSGVQGFFARRRYARIWGCRWEPLPLDLPAITPLTADREARASLVTVR